MFPYYFCISQANLFKRITLCYLFIDFSQLSSKSFDMLNTHLFQICDLDNDGIQNDKEIYQFQVSLPKFPIKLYLLEHFRRINCIDLIRFSNLLHQNCGKVGLSGYEWLSV